MEYFLFFGNFFLYDTKKPQNRFYAVCGFSAVFKVICVLDL